nr:immunoglobulin heavy chain junction region [Macaca mulatta]
CARTGSGIYYDFDYW